MNLRQIGGVLVSAGAACLLFYGVAFIYWVSNRGAIMTRVLLWTGVVSLLVGGVMYASAPVGRRLTR
jgi:uncharacterized membrane protein